MGSQPPVSHASAPPRATAPNATGRASRSTSDIRLASGSIDLDAETAPDAAVLHGLPLLVIPNQKGQFDPAARCLVRGGGHRLWLTDGGLWLTLLEPADPAALSDRLCQEQGEPPSDMVAPGYPSGRLVR
ncbi:MAG: hypothetical protein IT340_12825 [Chloroflexi bacterium]|nr:hypothetical protein [Chloroflexota bacterium]